MLPAWPRCCSAALDGGAVHIDSGWVVAQDCTFHSNSAGKLGGAVFVTEKRAEDGEGVAGGARQVQAQVQPIGLTWVVACVHCERQRASHG